MLFRSATTVTFEEAGKGIELVGKATENEPKKEHDDVFGVDVWSFELEYVITQKIKVTDPAIAAVKGEIEFQVCREGQCVRFDESFDIKIGDQPAAKTEVKAAAATDSSSDSTKDESLWIFFWGAFVAGLAAVVMPCVFPMIPMTVSFFMHGDTNKAKAKAKAIFFSLSIIAIYTALDILDKALAALNTAVENKPLSKALLEPFFFGKALLAGHRAADMLLVDVLFGDLDVVHRWPPCRKGAACPSLWGTLRLERLVKLCLYELLYAKQLVLSIER